MRVLVTGAGGFLGSRLVATLAASGPVIAVVRPGSAHHPAPVAQVELVDCDLADPTAIAGLPGEIEAVVHLAQAGSAEDPEPVNVLAVGSLLRHAERHGIGRLIFASSGSVYGSSPRRSQEEDPLRGDDAYSRSRIAGETLIRVADRAAAVTIIRPFHLYGSGQRHRLVADLVDRVRTGRTVTLPGGRGLRLTPTFIDDAVETIVALLSTSQPDIVNLAGDEAVDLADLAGLIGTLVGREPVLAAVDDEAPSIQGDNRRMRALRGGRPTTTLRAGLARMLTEKP